jgi:hypothetical protein
MSDISFRPRTYRFPMDINDWAALHRVLADLPAGTPAAISLGVTLDSVQYDAEDRFAMVTWSFTDVYNAAARLRGVAGAEYGDETSEEASGITRSQAEEIIDDAEGSMTDLMVLRGWDFLDLSVRDYLERNGIPVAEDEDVDDGGEDA